jgi:hypothetical protein
MANPVTEAHAAGKILGDQLTALEERAGIAKKAESARLGPLFPNLEASPDEYFREVEESARRRVRKLYFGVEDLALRKALIAKEREGARFCNQVLQDQLSRARAAVAGAQQRANSLPWLWAGTVAAVCVAIGAGIFAIYGAIAGALVGFFAGQGVISRARVARATELSAAQAALEEETKSQGKESLKPEWFNAAEERTGERDDAFDSESVIANFYDAQRREAERSAK